MADRVRRPSFQFYPGDWRRDPELQSCSVHSRGLWLEIMCLMHEAEPYGHLLIAGEKPTDAELARLVGETPAKLRALLAELERKCVFSRTDAGVIYSRRMVRDEHIRAVRAEAGRKGGNPKLGRREDKQGASDLVKQKRKQNPKQILTPSSSSSSSPSGETDLSGSSPDQVRAVFDYWQQRTGHSRATLTSDRRAKIKARLKRYSVEDLQRAVDGAVASPFHQGDNDRQQRYDFPETIFKTDATAERLMLSAEGAGERKAVIVDD